MYLTEEQIISRKDMFMEIIKNFFSKRRTTSATSPAGRVAGASA